MEGERARGGKKGGVYQGQWNEEGVLGEMGFERGREGGE